MEFIIIIISLISIIFLKLGLNIHIKDTKKIKKIGYDKDLNNIAKKFPENKEICKEILKSLKNENVEIQEDKESKTSLYIAISNKIIIANINDTFARIQTIAHECLHSIQNRKILLFNFIYSNIFLLYFVIAFLLILFNVGESIIYIHIFLIMTIVYCTVRCYLETEAMSKAKFVAKEYMEKQLEVNNNISMEDVNILIENFENLNKIGIPLTNFTIVVENIVKLIILCIVAII